MSKASRIGRMCAAKNSHPTTVVVASKLKVGMRIKMNSDIFSMITNIEKISIKITVWSVGGRKTFSNAQIVEVANE